MRGPLLQGLLEDRFKLKLHRETREVSVYALTVAKGSLKLERVADGSCTPANWDTLLFPVAGQQLPTAKACGFQTNSRKGPNRVKDIYAMSLDEFSKSLGLDRPVIDRTGITGMFNFHLEFLPNDAPAGAASDEPAGPSIFTAIQEQLGLKLEPAKGPREFIVIERVERPSEN